MNDLRLAFRQITKAPGFTAIIVLTLALGIGACTAIYSALDIVLHPYDDPATERNVHLRSIKLPQGVEGNLSLPDFLDLEKQARSFEFMAVGPSGEVDLTGTGEPLQLRRAVTTLRYFDLLGVKVTLGRAFLPEEFVAEKGNVVVLSYPCWQRVFGGPPDIVGRIVQINEKPHTVVGVVSERQERTGNNVDMWSPWTDFTEARYPRNSRTIRVAGARLRSGVTITQAQSELDVIAAALAQKYPATNSNYGLLALAHSGSQRVMIPIVQILFGSVVCLMLIACANVASLLLVRANARQKEMSVRAALGASRGRLIRQLLTEHIVVALIGGAIGVLLAHWALDFIRSSIPTGTMNLIAAAGGGSTSLRRIAYLELDGSVLAFALGLSAVTALVFGLAPAWLSSSANLNEALKQGTRGSSEGRSHGRLRVTLVALEIAIAFTLLACSGLLIRSFLKLAACDPGFDPKQVAFVQLNLSGARYADPAQKVAFGDALLDRLRNRADVEAAGLTSFFPLSAGVGNTPKGFEIEGRPSLPVADRPVAFNIAVSPDYFRALGIPLKQGRTFFATDDAKARRVVIINQTLARQHFPNADPIGERILLGNSPEDRREIVGVVGDVGQVAFGEAQPAQYYEPVAQQQGRFAIVVVRGRGDPARFPALIKKEVQTLDPNLPVGHMSTAEDFLRVNLTIMRLTLHLLTAFAVIALLIATIGIYGVMAFSVSQRTAEIGIRMALGAQKHDVLRMILRQGAWLVGIGVAVGIGGAFIAGRAIESLLYNTGGRDPATLVSMAVFFALVAALACWLPARRATKVDPMVALRTE